MFDKNSTAYINSVDYKTLETKIKELDTVLQDLSAKSVASRKLRYAEVDIEAEREEGRLAPDELFVPQHIIDTNIRREQAAYIQYVTGSQRAVICENQDDFTTNMDLLDRDLTKKLQFQGWQPPMFANIDGLQANGYGIVEQVFDINTPGHTAYEYVQYGDFGYLTDMRDLQACEMVSRAYYFTRTRLLAMCAQEGEQYQPDKHFSREQVEKIIKSDPTSSNTYITEDDTQNKSLYRLKKIMFRVNGIVHVAWCCPDTCDDWVRAPRPLFIGARKLVQQQPSQQQNVVPLQPQQQGGPQVPQSEPEYETQYPYFLFPYLISENDTVQHLKGRVFLDQDVQEAITSLTSSACTQSRRASGMYFSKDVSDPNDDLLLQKNIYFRTGALINSKVQAFKLDAPDPSIFSAIQLLTAGNQNETSQVNFAVNNRKDSRKTAKEIEVASTQAQVLSTVQVVLFSLALKNLYTSMVRVIKSRVLAGLIKVNPQVLPMYSMNFIVKPSGDVDVIEKQQMIQQMMSAWPVVQNTPAAVAFLSDLIALMFPANAMKYLQAFQQAQQQQQSQQAQQTQQMMGLLQQTAKGIIQLSKEPTMFSETGKIHVLPTLKAAALQFEELGKQQQAQQVASGQQKQAA